MTLIRIYNLSKLHISPANYEMFAGITHCSKRIFCNLEILLNLQSVISVHLLLIMTIHMYMNGPVIISRL